MLPIFLLLVCGLIDVGLTVYLNSTLSQAAREGARLGATEASWIGSTDASCGQPAGPVCPANIAEWRADVTTAVNRMITPFGPVPITSVFTSCDTSSPPSGGWTAQTCLQNAASGNVSVRITFQHQPITPIISQILGTINLSGSATMVIN